MDRHTGKPLDGTAHLAQSIGHILSTPLATMPMLRDYGSQLFELIDKPINGAIRMLIFAATATALRKWEPRLLLTRVVLSADGAAQGVLTIGIEGTRTDLPPSRAQTSLSISIPI